MSLKLLYHQTIVCSYEHTISKLLFFWLLKTCTNDYRVGVFGIMRGYERRASDVQRRDYQ